MKLSFKEIKIIIRKNKIEDFKNLVEEERDFFTNLNPKLQQDLFSVIETAKTAKDKKLLIKAFAKLPQYSGEFLDMLYDSEIKVRDFATKVLIAIDKKEHLELLEERSKVETSKAILKTLDKYLVNKKDIIKSLKKKVKGPNNYEENTPLWFDALAETDTSYLDMACEHIENFAGALRGAIGGRLFDPMANMKNDIGIKKVEWYTKNTSHKGLKTDAKIALNMKARKLNLSLEELRDTFI